MGVFRSEKTFPNFVTDLDPVARDVTAHFQGLGFEVTSEKKITGGWFISITKGNVFASVVGAQSALNIEIETVPQGTSAKAGIGIFGRQIIPALVARFVFWPILALQIAGMVHQAKLDNEALVCIQRSLTSHAGSAGSPIGQEPALFCTHCGAELLGAAKFCQECGEKMA